jgi:hypothetical protein
VHLLHGGSGGELKTGSAKAKLDQTQIGKGHYSGEDMAPDLAIGPVAQGQDTHQISSFDWRKASSTI